MRQTRQEPAQQWDQEQQTQQATRRDEASEISSRSDNIEIAAASHVLVRGLLDVITLTAPNIGHGAVACAASTSHSACAALLIRAHAASSSVSIRALHCTCITTIRPDNSCSTTRRST